MKSHKMLATIAAVIIVVLGFALRDVIISIVRSSWRQALQWHINPYIYMGLLMATFYHYYKGWFQIGRGLLQRNKAELFRGIALNRFVWAIPYVYVLIFGQGYPWWVPAGIGAWMLFGIVLFGYRLRNPQYAQGMANTYKKLRPMQFWRVQGWLYDALFALVPHRQLVQGVARSLEPGATVLDAGCGSGRLAEWSEADVTGVDFSGSVLRSAAKRSRKLAQSDLCGRVPFAAGTFDVVVSLNVLYAVPDPAAALQELARVLKPGGQLILATPVDKRLWPLVAAHVRSATASDWLRTIRSVPRLLAWVTNLAIRGVFENSTFSFFTQTELRELVTASGLTIISDTACYADLDRLIVASKGE